MSNAQTVSAQTVANILATHLEDFEQVDPPARYAAGGWVCLADRWGVMLAVSGRPGPRGQVRVMVGRTDAMRPAHVVAVDAYLVRASRVSRSVEPMRFLQRPDQVAESLRRDLVAPVRGVLGVLGEEVLHDGSEGAAAAPRLAVGRRLSAREVIGGVLPVLAWQVERTAAAEGGVTGEVALEVYLEGIEDLCRRVRAGEVVLRADRVAEEG